MIYIYTSDDCPRCTALKEEYTDKGIKFKERPASRLKTPSEDSDYIDREGLLVLSMQNETLPVVVDDSILND